MRIFLCVLTSLTFFASRAQTYLPVGNLGFSRWVPLPGSSLAGEVDHGNKKWYFTKYVGVSAGLGFYNGMSTMYTSVPFVLQLNHPINNNLIAFAGVSAAPVFFSYNRSFTDPTFYKSYPGINQNAYGFGMSSRVELGLMYVNDAKTFSISGSIGVERDSNPFYPAERRPVRKQQ